MFDQIRPIVVDENGVILAGNGLYEALIVLYWIFTILSALLTGWIVNLIF